MVISMHARYGGTKQMTKIARLILFACVATGSLAQSPHRPTLHLGAVEVYLGESRAEALADLERVGYVIDTPASGVVPTLQITYPFQNDHDQLLLFDRQGYGVNLTYQLTFKNGKVSFATRDWEGTLDGVVNALSQEDAKTCLLSHSHNVQPNVELESLVVVCSDRTFEIEKSSHAWGYDTKSRVVEQIGAS